MASEIYGNFVNYYEYLDLGKEATTEAIERAFDHMVASTEKQLLNPLTMSSALTLHNTIEPAIRQHLLSSPEARAAYDRQFAAYQEQQARRAELADEEGLDDVFRQPFYFDPFSFDTETPAYTLREIAMKFDDEWPQACKWITNTSDETHIFLSFLTHSAGRPRVARRIEPMMKALTAKQYSQRMGVNEAIERCIQVLNPQVERPLVSVCNPGFDGRIWMAGDFIADVPAQAELMLVHRGVRGCVFGTVESRTAWVKFEGKRSSVGFSLLSEGIDPRVGLSEIKIPLSFQIENFKRNTDYRAELRIRMENYQPPREITLPIQLHLLPTPPRVVFALPFAQGQTLPNEQPILVGTTRQGEPVSVQVSAFNSAGDQALVPLVGRITTHDSAASADPQTFAHEGQITLNIDTRNRSRGQMYEVVFDLDYGATPGAQGPATLRVRGEIVPTTWQSMQRAASLSARLATGGAGLFVGAVLFAAFGAILAYVGSQAWLVFLLSPFFFAGPLYLSWKALLRHRQHAGEMPATPEQISPWLIWCVPSAVGLLLFWLCLVAGGWAVVVSAIFGGIVGAIFGFTRAEKVGE